MTPMQERFAREYLIDHNAMQAALRAGYSPDCAQGSSFEFLEHPEIKPIIAKYAKKQAVKLELTAEKVLGELSRIAFFNPKSLYDSEGKLKNIEEIEDDAAICITSIEEEEIFDGYGKDRKRIGRLKKIKLASKIDALDKLGKHLKLFNDTVDINITVGLAERLQAARNRTVTLDNKPTDDGGLIDVTPNE